MRDLNLLQARKEGTPMPALFAIPQKQNDRIAEDVRRQLTWQTDIQSRDIHVTVNDGDVLLTGVVETRLEKFEAELAAKAVHGISSVDNRITVQPERERTDSEIEQDLVAALNTLAAILEEPPAATVKNGVATLRGRVRWNFQRHSAERAADAIIGVREVVNIIEVAPPAPAPCRQLARRRPDTTPALLSSTRKPQEEEANLVRPLFLVPATIGRA
jgi:osmotically-inducible protein OsmY